MLPQPPPMAALPQIQPGRIKVFGVIHIVFGALGILGALFNIAMGTLIPLLNQAMEGATTGSGAADPQMVELLAAVKTMLSDMIPVYLVKGLSGLVVAILILVAGIRLVKCRKSAVGSSNLYTWASIGARCLNLGVYLAIGMAASNRYYEAMEKLGPTSASAPGMGMMQFQQSMGVGVAIIGSLVAMVYPILAFIMLNKPVAKQFLADRGT